MKWAKVTPSSQPLLLYSSPFRGLAVGLKSTPPDAAYVAPDASGAVSDAWIAATRPVFKLGASIFNGRFFLNVPPDEPT